MGPSLADWGRFHGGTRFCTVHAIFITPGAKHDLAKISSQGLLKYDGVLGARRTCQWVSVVPSSFFSGSYSCLCLVLQARLLDCSLLLIYLPIADLNTILSDLGLLLACVSVTSSYTSYTCLEGRLFITMSIFRAPFR